MIHAEVEGMALYAYVGLDEGGNGVVGLKQALVPAGFIPLVAIAGHRDRLERDTVRDQLQRQADHFGKTIRLVRFVAVEEVMTIEPRLR